MYRYGKNFPGILTEDIPCLNSVVECLYDRLRFSLALEHSKTSGDTSMSFIYDSSK